MMERFSEYRIMWILVFFDLPTDTKKERRLAAQFRKDLIEDGFIMFQFSVYTRHCPFSENADVHIKRVKAKLPEHGKAAILKITDKQFGGMEIYDNQKVVTKEPQYIQLELF